MEFSHDRGPKPAWLSDEETVQMVEFFGAASTSSHSRQRRAGADEDLWRITDLFYVPEYCSRDMMKSLRIPSALEWPEMSPKRLFLLPSELQGIGGAAKAGEDNGADEVWSRPLIVGEQPKLLWKRRDNGVSS